VSHAPIFGASALVDYCSTSPPPRERGDCPARSPTWTQPVAAATEVIRELILNPACGLPTEGIRKFRAAERKEAEQRVLDNYRRVGGCLAGD
jgi:hypothetical protein